MDVPGGEDPHAQLVRPFLDGRRPLNRTPMPGEERAVADVRAYAITGGRARAAVQLEFETMLQATAAGREALTAMRFERAAILRLAQVEPLSVAELAARLALPIGVVRVVAADLVVEVLLESFHPSTSVADDVLLITRLIAGVRAL